MTTAVAPVDDLAYVAVLVGPGIITLSGPGMVRMHVGTVLPAVATAAWHPLAHGVDHQYSYSGSETTYARNDMVGSCDLIVTPML